MRKLSKVWPAALAAALLSGCQSGGVAEPDGVGSYDYCMRDYRALETAYRHDLARGKYARHQSLVQPRNIKETCLVRMWSQEDGGSYDLSWNGECRNSRAYGLGMVTLFTKDGAVDSRRLYEAREDGSTSAYFGLSEGSGKIWYGLDDGHQARFFVADAGREEGGEYALSSIDYDKAKTLEFIFSDEGAASVRLHPNYSEMYSRSYTEGNYISDLFYALYALNPEGQSAMTGVGFVYSGHDDDLTVLDVSSGNRGAQEESDGAALNTRYMIERLDGEKELIRERQALSAQLSDDLRQARSKLKAYQRMVCRDRQYEKLHLSAHEAAGICVLKARVPQKLGH